MLFSRFGKVGRVLSDYSQASGYHAPPAREGFYAFPAGFEERALYDWRYFEFEKNSYSSLEEWESANALLFEVGEGFVWHHLNGEGVANCPGERHGSWVRSSIADFRIAVEEERLSIVQECGAVEHCSLYHMEVFFELDPNKVEFI